MTPCALDSFSRVLGTERRGNTRPGAPALIPDEELMQLLVNNGYAGAAEDLIGGQTQEQATARIAGRGAYYHDGEGLWLQNYIDRLHAVEPGARATPEDAAD